AEKMAKQKDKDAVQEFNVLNKLKQALEEGKPGRSVSLTEEEGKIAHGLHLLTLKPVLYVANVAEDEVADGDNNAYVEKVKAIAQLDQEEKDMFLEELGIEQSGLDQLIKTSYELLGLGTYFTAGEQEVRAWTFKKGMTAPQAAGIIHTDFERGFIRAETVSYTDLMEAGSMAKARENGKVRLEGKEYIVQDGDVIHFRFNV